MYKLEKLKLEDGKHSAVDEGHVTVGDTLGVNTRLDPSPTPVEIKDIVEDNQIFIESISRWHRTSPIAEIISRDDCSITFKTQTSIYKLTEYRD